MGESIRAEAVATINNPTNTKIKRAGRGAKTIAGKKGDPPVLSFSAGSGIYPK